MRKLMWFSIGFAAACAVSMYLLPAPSMLILGVALLAAGIGLLFIRKGIRIRILTVVCLGLAAGLLWCGAYDMLRLTPVRGKDGQTHEITLKATDYSFDTDYGICVDGTVKLSGGQYRVRMYVNQKEPLSPGDQVIGNFRLRYTAPGALEDMTYHSGKGILLLAYPKGTASVVAGEGKSVLYCGAYLREEVLSLIQSLFPEDTVGFAKALLLGDTSGLDYKKETALSVSGLRHVAAVSGLHVSILFSMVYLFLGRRRILAAVLGIPVLTIFAAMAGFSPSILRAGIMQTLMLLAMAVDKEYDPPTALAFAVLAMLAVNPVAVTAVGFQLSVACVAGIFLFAVKIRDWLRRCVRFRQKNSIWKRLYYRTTAAVSITVSAMIATTPLTALYFGSVNLLSVFTNLLCLWIVTILFCGIIAACVLGTFWTAGGRMLSWVLGWLVRYVLGIAEGIAGIPLAAVYTQSIFVAIWLVLCYVLLAVLLRMKKKRPLLLGSCAVLLLCAALLLSWILPLTDHYRVTVLDVGQGQCVLLQSGGRTYMVDCGGSYAEDTADTAAEMLLSQGIQRLDGLILTHYDKDHVGAATFLLQRIPTDILILPEGEDAQQWEETFRMHHDGTIIHAYEDLEIQWNDAKISVYSAWTTETSNESSLCVLFHTEKCDILITGDRSAVGEEILLQMAEIPHLDALVVGHHGSSKSTGEILLAATQPKVALISVGEGNAYDHPAEEVLARLKTYGCVVRRTDMEGTIIIRG